MTSLFDGKAHVWKGRWYKVAPLVHNDTFHMPFEKNRITNRMPYQIYRTYLIPYQIYGTYLIPNQIYGMYRVL